MIAATYINGSMFSVSGEEAVLNNSFRPGQPVVLDMGADGLLRTDITATVYDAELTILTITTMTEAITENLTEVTRSPLYVDPANQQSNMPLHGHSAGWDGGEMSAAGFADATTVSHLNGIAGVDEYVAGFLVGANLAGDGFSKYELRGTTNQISITQDEVSITFAEAQDLHPLATPMFAGLKLSSLTGLMLSNGEDGCTTVEPSAGHQVLRTNEDNTGYSFVELKLANLTEVDISGELIHNHPLVYKADTQKFSLGDVSSGGGVSLGMVIALMD